MLKPYFESGSVVIYHGNCESILPAFPDESFAAVVTDPPFSMADGWLHDRDAITFLKTFDLLRLIKMWTGQAIIITNPMSGIVRAVRDRDVNPWFTPMIGLAPIQSDGHPAERPLYMMNRIVQQVKGAVLDPFMGSGTTLLAAQLTGKPAVGIEIEEKYCELAAQRLMLGKEDAA